MNILGILGFWVWGVWGGFGVLGDFDDFLACGRIAKHDRVHRSTNLYGMYSFYEATVMIVRAYLYIYIYIYHISHTYIFAWRL